MRPGLHPGYGRVARVQPGSLPARSFRRLPLEQRTLALDAALAADQPRRLEAVLRVAREHLGIVAESDRADSALALRDQDCAERALADGEADVGVRAAGTPCGGRHAQYRVRLRIEAAVG